MKQVLDSGARVLLDRVPGAEVASIHLRVGVGAADEQAGEHGAAHFMEHMIFKGGPGLGVGEVAGAFEAMGGDVNAFTSHDRTVFYATVPTARWRESLELLSAMTLRCALDPEEVNLEREVILDELRGVESDPGEVLADAVAEASYAAHPYGRPVIGTLDSVRGLDAPALRAFHERHYHPGNMILVVSGDVGPAELIEAAEACLAGPHRAPSPGERPAEPEQTQAREVLLRGRFEETRVELALPGVPRDHADAVALDVLLTALCNGAGSILGEDLQVERGLVVELWGACESNLDDGRLLIGCVPKRGMARKAVMALGKGLRRAALEGVPVDALNRARSRVQADRLFELETVEGRAHSWLWYEESFGEPEYEAQLQAQLVGLTPADLRRVARRYLRLDRCTLGLNVPKGEPGCEGLAQALAALPMPSVKPRPAIVKKVLESGATLIVEPREDSAVAAVQAVTLGGQLAERPATAGVSSLWARTVGVQDLDAVDLDRWLDTRGASLEGVDGRSTLGVRCELPARYIDDALRLVSDIVCYPHFHEEDVERSVDDMAEQIASITDSAASWARQEGERVLFAPHPYALPTLGTEASLQRLGVASLERLHDRLFTAPGLVVAVVGAVEPEAVFERLEAELEPLSTEASLLPARRPARWPRRARRLALSTEDRGQAYVLLMWPGLRVSDPDVEALELAATILGGQSGRLFMELRERRGLAYNVSAASTEAWDPGQLSAWMSIEPGREAEGAAALRAEVQRLAEGGPGAEELERAKAATLGALAMGRQCSGDRAVELAYQERYGWDAQTVRARTEARYAEVTCEQVRQALAARLAASPGVEVTVSSEVTARRSSA
ncbi:MAG: insulinase family protein [Alphaproteobacteria bacterium]|nr:insulinase family protein [Alphaproteobacteria bacterium]